MYTGADRFTEHHFLQVSDGIHIEYDERKAVFFAHRRGRQGVLQPGNPVGGQERGVAGGYGQPLGGAGGQGSMNAGQGAGHVGQPVRQDRMALLAVVVQVAVGADDQALHLWGQVVDGPGDQRPARQGQQSLVGAGVGSLQAPGCSTGQPLSSARWPAMSSPNSAW